MLVYLWIRLPFGIFIFIGLIDVIFNAWSMVFGDEIRFGGDLLEEMS